MFRRILILLAILIFALNISGQNEKYTAPVKWERYKVEKNGVSILFPKLPVFDETINGCTEEKTHKYAAYAEGIVYGLNIAFKSKPDVRYDCKERKKFDEKNFEDRLKEIKTLLKTEEETKLIQNESELIKVKGELFTYWLANDFKNKRWFEVWVTEQTETDLIKNFIESLKFEEKPSGIEIKNGSPITLGDEAREVAGSTEIVEDSVVNSSKEFTGKLRIILKPRAKYTDRARQESVQGTVFLKVVFSANGGVEKITVVSGLPFGITEESVAAARKMVFVPSKKNNQTYSVVRTVQYNFRLY